MEKGTVRHVAIIMDGNGRWADRRGLPRVEGHRQGARQVSEVLEAAQEAGVEFLTLYAFSTENWKRPPSEVAALMGLLEEFLDDKLPELMEKNVRLRTVGRTDGLPAGARRKLLPKRWIRWAKSSVSYAGSPFIQQTAPGCRRIWRCY